MVVKKTSVKNPVRYNENDHVLASLCLVLDMYREVVYHVSFYSSEVLPAPTLEMVRAQFYVPEPGTEQQDPR